MVPGGKHLLQGGLLAPVWWDRLGWVLGHRGEAIVPRGITSKAAGEPGAVENWLGKKGEELMGET